MRLSYSPLSALGSLGLDPDALNRFLVEAFGGGEDRVVRMAYAAGPPVVWGSMLVETSGTGNLDVNVRAGLYVVNLKPVFKQTATVITFPEGADTYDYIRADEYGVISRVQGGGGAGSATLGANHILLGEVFNGTDDNITSANITDKRVFA